MLCMLQYTLILDFTMCSRLDGAGKSRFGLLDRNSASTVTSEVPPAFTGSRSSIKKTCHSEDQGD